MKLEQYELFDLRKERLKNKSQFYYLTHKGCGLYYKAQRPALSRIRERTGSDVYLAPQRHSQIVVLEHIAKAMEFDVEIRDYQGNIIKEIKYAVGNN